ncbi:farnesyl cysteine-carboxyl methyltransferase [Coemansia sp. RSA 1290]|nr:farnesyl cysteine-carboxyl methyltransferase [Coemansia sp. RSA 1290]KAJ2668730.1 farnesyl cysteine-carboxyl methyltransferase [Coemansia sp. RSA 1085]
MSEPESHLTETQTSRLKEEKWWTPVDPVDWSENSPQSIALTACALGLAIGGGLCAAVLQGWQSTGGTFGLYVAIVAMYHMLEYLSVALYNPGYLEIDSFMFNPDVGNGYITAMGVSLAEFWLEWWCGMFTGSNTRLVYLCKLVGLTMAVVGQVMRTLAMVTAKTSFNHYVATRKEKSHRLITHGIYAWERHPSYVGFFVWSVGLQTMLLNPISCVLFAAVLAYFFKRRVQREERFLLRFFGREYEQYQRQVSSLIAFI